MCVYIYILVCACKYNCIYIAVYVCIYIIVYNCIYNCMYTYYIYIYHCFSYGNICCSYLFPSVFISPKSRQKISSRHPALAPERLRVQGCSWYVFFVTSNRKAGELGDGLWVGLPPCQLITENTCYFSGIFHAWVDQIRPEIQKKTDQTNENLKQRPFSKLIKINMDVS